MNITKADIIIPLFTGILSVLITYTALDMSHTKVVRDYKYKLIDATNTIHNLQHELESHGHDENSHAGMHHKPLAIDETDWRPSVQLEMSKDPMSGWNAHIITENFEFAPELASTDHVEGKGHAHIYIDDIKISRVYGSWFHLGNVDPGEHQVKVNLNANNHRALTFSGSEIAAYAIIEEPIEAVSSGSTQKVDGMKMQMSGSMKNMPNTEMKDM